MPGNSGADHSKSHFFWTGIRVRRPLWKDISCVHIHTFTFRGEVGDRGWDGWMASLTHWERPWCWERLRAGGEGDGRGWAGWTASPTQWTWLWTILGYGEGSLARCNPWGHKESDMTERPTTTATTTTTDRQIDRISILIFQSTDQLTKRVMTRTFLDGPKEVGRINIMEKCSNWLQVCELVWSIRRTN